MSLVLAVDIYTASCRCALYNRKLQRLGTEIVEYSTQYPKPDWEDRVRNSIKVKHPMRVAFLDG